MPDETIELIREACDDYSHGRINGFILWRRIWALVSKP